jgi:hypothetical protein
MVKSSSHGEPGAGTGAAQTRPASSVAATATPTTRAREPI